jgi:hypothetical protein
VVEDSNTEVSIPTNKPSIDTMENYDAIVN